VSINYFNLRDKNQNFTLNLKIEICTLKKEETYTFSISQSGSLMTQCYLHFTNRGASGKKHLAKNAFQTHVQNVNHNTKVSQK